MRGKQICGRCGYLHAQLGVMIFERELHRIVRTENARINKHGGYGFIARFWDYHRDDFDSITIEDRARGQVWHGDRRTIAGVIRETLSAGYGEQVIVLCRLMRFDAAPGGEAGSTKWSPLPDRDGK